MIISFAIISLSCYAMTIRIWNKRSSYSGLKIELIALALGLIAFNVALGLLLLFDTIETNPTDVIQVLIRDSWTFTSLCFCIFNVLFFCFFTIMFLIKNDQKEEHA